MIYRERLREFREENSVLQKDIAKLLGIEQSVYSHYETEYAIIPTKHLIKVCEFFNVSLDYIFEFTSVKNYDNNTNYIDKLKSGQRLKEFRKDNNLTQVKLASILNTVHPVITNYENGKNLIATPFLYMICKKYKISADYLLGKIDEPKYLE